MRRVKSITASITKAGGIWLPLSLAGMALVLAWWTRHSPASHNPLLYSHLQFTSGILAFTTAAAALVRFRATSDRLPLVLACGFAIVGVSLAAPSFVFLRTSSSDLGGALKDPIPWVISRTLLGLLFVAALVVERRLPTARNPVREIAIALFVAVLTTGVLATLHALLPADLARFSRGVVPRPGNLFPAALFLLATVQYRRRLVRTTFPSDYALYYGAVLNLACSLAASQSEPALDTPFVLAGVLQFGSYAVLLGGALLDDIQLFENIHQLSVTDPLTGLANYRQFIDALRLEIERSGRTGRSFALVLFDLDGLKKINDVYGHLVGSRALCRVANILRLHSRAIDTCARYGGDEFALILPETDATEADEAMARICTKVAEDSEQPSLSISAGIAIHPDDAEVGEEIKSLIRAADWALYGSKRFNILKSDPKSGN